MEITFEIMKFNKNNNFSASLVRLGLGTASYWSSPALPYLRSPISSFPITSDDASWLASLLNIGAIIGYLLYPLLIDRVGRKYTMLIFYIPQIVSWLLIFFANNVIYLFIGRLLSGIGYNGGYIVESIYEGEIAEKDIRGSLVVLGKIFYISGSLITLTAGAFLSYDNMNLLLLLSSFLFILTFPFMPESPYFYLKVNRKNDALKSLSRLRGIKDSSKLEMEINILQADIINNQLSEKHSLRQIFENKRHRKALLIAFLASMNVQFSGTFAIAAFIQNIVSYIGFPLASEYTTIIITTLVLILSILVAPLTDYLGRRILTLSYGILGASSAGIIGLFFFFKFYLQVENISSFSWVPFIALTIHIVSCSSELFSISVILSAEIFSLEVKSSGSSLLNIVSNLLGFFVKLIFDRLVSILGLYGVFWIFGVSCLVLSVITFYIMPETKGKSLEEIQMLLD